MTITTATTITTGAATMTITATDFAPLGRTPAFSAGVLAIEPQEKLAGTSSARSCRSPGP
jgi:hypothetical protein